MMWWRWFAVWMRGRADEGLGEGMGVEVDWGLLAVVDFDGAD